MRGEGAMRHWHDMPGFNLVRDARVALLKATDDDEATHVCRHEGLDYFMRSQRTGEGTFMCRACCQENVELELLILDEPPAETDSAEGAQGPRGPGASAGHQYDGDQRVGRNVAARVSS